MEQMAHWQDISKQTSRRMLHMEADLLRIVTLRTEKILVQGVPAFRIRHLPHRLD